MLPRLVPIASLLAAACADDPPSGPPVDSHVAFYERVAALPPQLDLLLVLDRSLTMAPYQTQLASLAGAVEALVVDGSGPEPDTRIAVTTTDGDGTFRTPGILENGYTARYERQPSYTGSLADALAPLLDVGAEGTDASRPLEAAKLALDANPSFLRPDAVLGIVTITASDDASPGTLADYKALLDARKADPLRIALVGVHDQPADRLDAFYAEYPNRNLVRDIATVDVAEALSLYTMLTRTVLGVACVPEPADADASTPGTQYDCDMNAYYEDGTSERIPPCVAGLTGPCFEVQADPSLCMVEGTGWFAARGFPTQYTPRIAGQCVVTGGN